MSNKVVSAASLRRRVIGLSLAAALGGFLFGFDSSVINGAVAALQSHFDMSSAVLGFAVASALLGCAVGAFAAGRLADSFGRIRVMIIGGVLFFASSIGAGLAFSVPDLILWRVIGGLGIGIASVIAPAYIAEIAPKAIRGSLASLQQLAITIGIFAALLTDASLANTAGGAENTLWLGLEAWRWMFIACAVPAVIYTLISFGLPESPRFLALKGKTEQAGGVLSQILPADQVKDALADIHTEIEQDAKNKNSASLRGKAFGLLPVVWVGILLSMFQQFVGINVIFYYSTDLWTAVGFPASASFTISVVTSLINVAVTFVAIALVDKIGRRLLLLIGSAGMAISLGMMTLAFSQSTIVDGHPSLSGVFAPIALIGANAFVIFFGATWGPVVWVLLGEIFPGRIRAKALGVAAMAQWISNWVITVTFPYLSQQVSLPLTYGLYTAFAALSFFFVFAKVPETKGVALENVDELMARGARKAVKTSS
jgi:SP family sugar:H+ symporter-like MFS transporter